MDSDMKEKEDQRLQEGKSSMASFDLNRTATDDEQNVSGGQHEVSITDTTAEASISQGNYQAEATFSRRPSVMQSAQMTSQYIGEELLTNTTSEASRSQGNYRAEAMFCPRPSVMQSAQMPRQYIEVSITNATAEASVPQGNYQAEATFSRRPSVMQSAQMHSRYTGEELLTNATSEASRSQGNYQAEAMTGHRIPVMASQPLPVGVFPSVQGGHAETAIDHMLLATQQIHMCRQYGGTYGIARSQNYLPSGVHQNLPSGSEVSIAGGSQRDLNVYPGLQGSTLEEIFQQGPATQTHFQGNTSQEWHLADPFQLTQGMLPHHGQIYRPTVDNMPHRFLPNTQQEVSNYENAFQMVEPNWQQSHQMVEPNWRQSHQMVEPNWQLSRQMVEPNWQQSHQMVEPNWQQSHVPSMNSGSVPQYYYTARDYRPRSSQMQTGSGNDRTVSHQSSDSHQGGRTRYNTIPSNMQTPSRGRTVSTPLLTNMASATVPSARRSTELLQQTSPSPSMGPSVQVDSLHTSQAASSGVLLQVGSSKDAAQPSISSHPSSTPNEPKTTFKNQCDRSGSTTQKPPYARASGQRLEQMKPSASHSQHYVSVDHIRADDPLPTLVEQKCMLCNIDLGLDPTRSSSSFQNLPRCALLPCGHCYHDDCLVGIYGSPDVGQEPPCFHCSEEKDPITG